MIMSKLITFIQIVSEDKVYDDDDDDGPQTLSNEKISLGPFGQISNQVKRLKNYKADPEEH